MQDFPHEPAAGYRHDGHGQTDQRGARIVRRQVLFGRRNTLDSKGPSARRKLLQESANRWREGNERNLTGGGLRSGELSSPIQTGQDQSTS